MFVADVPAKRSIRQCAEPHRTNAPSAAHPRARPPSARGGLRAASHRTLPAGAASAHRARPSHAEAHAAWPRRLRADGPANPSSRARCRVPRRACEGPCPASSRHSKARHHSPATARRLPARAFRASRTRIRQARWRSAPKHAVLRLAVRCSVRRSVVRHSTISKVSSAIRADPALVSSGTRRHDMPAARTRHRR